jgi:enterobacterial common antigen flippase
VLALLHRLTPTTSAFAYVLPLVPMFLYVFANIARRVRPVFRLRRDLVRRLLRYGVRLSGVDVLGALSGRLDQMVIVAMLPAGMVGTYAVALSSARILTVVQGGISSVLFPSVAARETAAIVRTVATAFRMATLLIGGLAAVLALIGPSVLLFAYGEAFAPAIAPFRVLLLAMVAENGARILYQIYSGSGRPGLVTVFEGVAVTVLLLTMLALVPALGTLGAAAAVLCAACFRLMAAIAALPLLLKHDLPRLVIGWPDVRMAVALLARLRDAALATVPEPLP